MNENEINFNNEFEVLNKVHHNEQKLTVSFDNNNEHFNISSELISLRLDFGMAKSEYYNMTDARC